MSVRLLAALVALSVPAAPAAAPDPFAHVFERLYNWDFAAANRSVDAHIAARPADPLGHAVRGAVLLFEEMDRLGILESEFFASDKRIAEKKKPKADPELRRRLFAAVAEARRLGTARLAADPEERNALFALCMASGVATDYTSFVEKGLWSALKMARESHDYALRLLRRDPSFRDAYLTTGLHEYLVGSLPFFARWFVRFEDTAGDKRQAVKHLELVAREGRYYKPFAKVLLAVIHLREKRPLEAERLLAELSREYPENPMVRRELAKLAERTRKAAEEAQGR